MIVIGVTGSRYWRDRKVVEDALDEAAEGHGTVLVRHGMCPPRFANSGRYVSWGQGLRMEAAGNKGGLLGADWFADRHAVRRGWRTQQYPADWAQYRLRAGVVRNEVMVRDGADLWLAFMHPGSIGTADCVRRAEFMQIPVRRFHEEVLVGDGEE